MNYQVSVVIFNNLNNTITLKIIKSPEPQDLPMPPHEWFKLKN